MAPTIAASSVPTSRTVPAVDGLGPLRRVAEHEHRLAEARAFLLDAAAVGEDQVGAPHQADEAAICERLDDADVRDVAEHRHDGFADDRVAMHREDDEHVGLGQRDLGDGARRSQL